MVLVIVFNHDFDIVVVVVSDDGRCGIDVPVVVVVFDGYCGGMGIAADTKVLLLVVADEDTQCV